jgi:molybdopterin converting factor small subunit
MKRKRPQDSYFDNYYDVTGLDQMSIIVTIPASLRKKWLEAQEQVSCEGKTIGECLDHLDQRFPGFKGTLLDEKGNIKETITIFLCGQNIRNLDKLSTFVQDNDEISIIPFMAGG